MSEEIHILTNQYFQQVDLPHLAIPPNNVLIQPSVQEALYEDMFKDSLTPLPPASYRSRVLKLLISRMEEAITDPDQDVRQNYPHRSTKKKSMIPHTPSNSLLIYPLRKSSTH